MVILNEDQKERLLFIKFILKKRHMPTEYSCSWCGHRFSIGLYHGTSDWWYTALYCRYCGVQALLKQRSHQLFSAKGRFHDYEQAQYLYYEMIGPVTPKRISIDIQTGESQEIKCACGAKGPFGPKGPITDKTPEGLERQPGLCIEADSKGRKTIGGYVIKNYQELIYTLKNVPVQRNQGVCPKCKQKTLKVRENWVS